MTLTLGDRKFSGALQQPAFLTVRLEAGPLAVKAQSTGVQDLERIVFTPLPPGNETEKRFLAFEKRSPRVGVHLGLRRDCGSTLAPVGPPQTVAGEKLARYVFEGAMRNFPSPALGKDNVNYLAGVHEIGVRSEYTDGRDMPRLVIRSVEFEGPYYDVLATAVAQEHLHRFRAQKRSSDVCARDHQPLRDPCLPPPGDRCRRRRR